MIKSIVTLIFLFILKFLHAQNPGKAFKIVGQVQGFTNGTKLYLNDVTDGSYKKIDSVIIFNNRFSFNGSLINDYLKASISTADYADRVILWLEKGVTSFNADKGSFNKAVIMGGANQKKWSEYMNILTKANNEDAATYWFIKNNPASIIAAHNLSVYINSWGKDTVTALYKSFSADVKSTSYGTKINNFITLNRNLKIGDKFVDFTQKDSSSKNISLSDIKDKVILLEFWGSWCEPCREENPTLIKIYNDHKNKGFEILGVAAETNKAQWIKGIETDRLPWVNVTDLQGSDNKAAMIYSVSAYPTNFLIDKTGTIIAKDVYGEDLRSWLLKIL